MLRIQYSNTNFAGDLVIDPATLGHDTTRPLDTAVLLSLLCDARADDDADIPEGSERRGWWAEGFFDESDTWGSGLWQVLVGKATAQSLDDARRHCERALQWMITDGICRRVEVSTWWLEGRRGYLGILVTLYKPNETDPEYVGPWEIYYAVE